MMILSTIDPASAVIGGVGTIPAVVLFIRLMAVAFAPWDRFFGSKDRRDREHATHHDPCEKLVTPLQEMAAAIKTMAHGINNIQNSLAMEKAVREAVERERNHRSHFPPA